MNKRDYDLLQAIASCHYPGQRELATACGYSLGAVNASVKRLVDANYVDKQLQLTDYGRQQLLADAPQRAILLADGFGLRQPPNNGEIPRALLQVRSQRLIDRLIEQLQEAGVPEIYVVVGFAKEQFEYLIDRYRVHLIVNADYADTGSLHSLALGQELLSRCYIVPCDVWCKENPFRKAELYSWYAVSKETDPGSTLRVNRKQELVVDTAHDGNRRIGISYLTQQDAPVLQKQLQRMDTDSLCQSDAWEKVLFDGNKLRVCPRLTDAGQVVKIQTYADLQKLNDETRTAARRQSSCFLGIPEDGIEALTILKSGMTNTTFRFRWNGESYCIRIPSGRKDNLINRKREADIYAVIAPHRLGDAALFLDPDTGCKLSRWISDTRPCDPRDPKDVALCMQKLRQFHDLNLQVEETFDLFEAIAFYESAWGSKTSMYEDYANTRHHVFSLRSYIDSQDNALCLSHIDPVSENFLITRDGQVRLIDWEYAAAHDPHLDIAMFCLQSLYDRSQVDAAIDAYFPEGCSQATRLKIYCYLSAGGLLWSNWCEYEMQHGTEFGAYSLRQYRYAKEYYRIVQQALTQKEEL